MKLPDKEGFRLNTKNFLRVKSSAVRSMDYSGRKHILEIEYISRDVYHYLKVPGSEWKHLLELQLSGESLGTYVNQEIKPRYNYYKLLVLDAGLKET